jgi:hypothetical protein
MAPIRKANTWVATKKSINRSSPSTLGLASAETLTASLRSGGAVRSTIIGVNQGRQETRALFMFGVELPVVRSLAVALARRLEKQLGNFVETKQGRVIPTRMATTKTTPQTHTITEAAKKLGISRQAVHKAIRRGLLEAERATITETIVGES